MYKDFYRKELTKERAKGIMIEVMKTKSLRAIAPVLAIVVAMATFSASASLTGEQVATVKSTLAKVSAVELAPNAAQLVKNAPKADQLDMAVAVIQAVVAQNSSAVVAVVSAIATAVPEVAPVVAATAAKALQAQADLIAAAAAKAAPAQAEKVVQAVIAAVPTAQAAVEARVLPVRSGPIAGAAGSIVMQSGLIHGGATPAKAPTAAPKPSAGYDPHRYAGP